MDLTNINLKIPKKATRGNKQTGPTTNRQGQSQLATDQQNCPLATTDVNEAFGPTAEPRLCNDAGFKWNQRQQQLVDIRDAVPLVTLSCG